MHGKRPERDRCPQSQPNNARSLFLRIVGPAMATRAASKTSATGIHRTTKASVDACNENNHTIETSSFALRYISSGTPAGRVMRHAVCGMRYAVGSSCLGSVRRVYPLDQGVGLSPATVDMRLATQRLTG